MYSILREVKEDRLCGERAVLLENKFDLVDHINRMAPKIVKYEAFRHNGSHLVDGISIRMESYEDGSGLHLSMEYRRITDSPQPSYRDVHTFRNPQNVVTIIRVYGEYEEHSKQVAERMGAIGRRVIMKEFAGMSADCVTDEVHDLAHRFVKRVAEKFPKEAHYPMTYGKPKTTPPTSRDYKGYKKWQR
jgi:hypothetical protein